MSWSVLVLSRGYLFFYRRYDQPRWFVGGRRRPTGASYDLTIFTAEKGFFAGKDGHVIEGEMLPLLAFQFDDGAPSVTIEGKACPRTRRGQAAGQVGRRAARTEEEVRQRREVVELTQARIDKLNAPLVAGAFPPRRGALLALSAPPARWAARVDSLRQGQSSPVTGSSRRP